MLPLSFSKLRDALLPGRKKRILILISDTGGGHRASAQVRAAFPPYLIRRRRSRVPQRRRW
jgi:hypothetical protein